MMCKPARRERSNMAVNSDALLRPFAALTPGASRRLRLR